MSESHHGRLIRLIILLGLLVASLQIYRWSRTNDPRFYLFLQSRPGRVLARVFHWQRSDQVLIPEDKPDEELTAAEREWKQKMLREIESRQPRYRLETTEGKQLLGWIAESNSQYVVFEEKYGESGSLKVKVPAGKIKLLEPLPLKMPEITYRDVRFQMEFPRMKFYKKPPYSILTDETYFHVERSVRTLQELQNEFMTYFRALIPNPASRLPSLQVLFFSDEKQFKNYQKQYSRLMEAAAGFYSPQLRRLVIYNEKRSGWMEEVEEELRNGTTDQGLTRPAAALRKRQVERALLHEAEQRTFVTLRHEGAHQLFFTYGIHSDFRVENDWLVEGLAVFMETRPAGRKDNRRVALLHKAMEKDQLMPLEKLVNFRHSRGFLALGDLDRVELAYCQSWALVYYLMSSLERRNGLFEYIRYIRDPKHVKEVVRTSRLELLARFLQTTTRRLENDYRDFLSRL